MPLPYRRQPRRASNPDVQRLVEIALADTARHTIWRSLADNSASLDSWRWNTEVYAKYKRDLGAYVGAIDRATIGAATDMLREHTTWT